MKKLSVIIVSYNTRIYLKNCLLTLIKSLTVAGIFNDTEIIVVDNASSDGSQVMLKGKFPQIKLIENIRNIGFGQANNQGINIANSNLILLLNSDTRVFPETIKETVRVIENHKEIGVLGCKLLNKDGSVQQSAGYFPTLLRVLLWMFFIDDIPFIQRLVKPYHLTDLKAYNNQLQVDWVSGAFMLIRKECCANNDLFDPKVFMYTEEVDLCYRIQKRGWRIIYSPVATLIHEKGCSGIGSDSGILEELYGLEYLAKKYFSKNTAYLYKQALSLGTLLRYIVFGIIKGSEKRRQAYLKYLKLAR